MHFGLTDRSGKPKPQLAEIARFSRLLADLGETGWEPIAGEVAIVVPEHFERSLAFTTVDYRDDIRDNLLQAYIAAREADLPVSLVREADGLGETARLFLLPSTKLLMAPTAKRLVQLAEGGATVYLSYFAGSAPSQVGPWVPWLGELFGIRHHLRYGLVDPIEDDEVVFSFTEAFGDLAPGDELRFRVAGNKSSRALLPIEPAGATVVAVDGRGRPALVRRQVGDGAMVLCTYPTEHMAARAARVNPESTWRLYSALATSAGIDRPLSVRDPRVITGGLRTPAGELAVLVNASPDQVEVSIATAGSASYRRRGAEPGEALSRLKLAPFEVEVLSRLT